MLRPDKFISGWDLIREEEHIRNAVLNENDEMAVECKQMGQAQCGGRGAGRGGEGRGGIGAGKQGFTTLVFFYISIRALETRTGCLSIHTQFGLVFFGGGGRESRVLQHFFSVATRWESPSERDVAAKN